MHNTEKHMNAAGDQSTLDYGFGGRTMTSNNMMNFVIVQRKRKSCREPLYGIVLQNGYTVKAAKAEGRQTMKYVLVKPHKLYNLVIINFVLFSTRRPQTGTC